MIESTQNRTATEAQSALLSYWQTLCSENELPKRGAFDPGTVLRYLGDMSIYELTETGALKCRVTNTRLARQTKGQVSTHTGLEALLSAQAPVIGQNKTEQGVHHWLRLPMLSDCGQRLMILCHDEIVTERRTDPISNKMSPQRQAIAA